MGAREQDHDIKLVFGVFSSTLRDDAQILCKTPSLFSLESLHCIHCALSNYSRSSFIVCTSELTNIFQVTSDRVVRDLLETPPITYSPICGGLPCSDLRLGRGTRSSVTLCLGPAHNLGSNEIPHSRSATTFIMTNCYVH